MGPRFYPQSKVNEYFKRFAEFDIGETRTYQMYPIASINRYGGRIVGASDFFVTDMNPLLAMEVAITRQDPYTINGAYTMKLDDRQGSIEVGKRADLVVLDRNLFEIPTTEISEAKVTLTLFNGEAVYASPR